MGEILYSPFLKKLIADLSPPKLESEAVAARPHVSCQQLPNEIKTTLYHFLFFFSSCFYYNFFFFLVCFWVGKNTDFSGLGITIVCGRDFKLLKANKTCHMCMVVL